MDSTGNQMCSFCQQFTTDLLSSDFMRIKNYAFDSRWADEPQGDDYYGFRHYKTLDELWESASSCAVCRVIQDDFANFAARPAMLDLGLYPDYPERVPSPAPYRDIIAGTFGDWTSQNLPPPNSFHPFSQSVRKRHLFNVSKIRPHKARLLSGMACDAEADGFLRDVPDSASSEGTLATARIWVEECTRHHPECSTQIGPLPTRVIDVEVGPGDSASLYVARNGEKEHYVALSHVWGGDIPLKTTTANFDAYQQALPINELPKNFRDAITFTRSIGLRYLWIDAICIVQDSPEDWHAEVAKMATIYGNARVTISALNSKNSTSGFLLPRRRQKALLGSSLVLSRFPLSFREEFNQSSLRQRAWCFQEMLLSKCLLHIGRDQMHWQCCKIRAQENGEPEDMNFEKEVLDRIHSSVGRPRSVDEWYMVVAEFSHRNLTYDNDRLPALAGIASRFKVAGIGGEYIAGLWAEDLHNGIFWIVDPLGDYQPLIRPTEPQVPSWSWASGHPCVWFPPIERPSHPSFEILEVRVAAGKDDLAASKVDATLRIRGPLVKARYVVHEEPQGASHLELGNEFVLNGVYMDFDNNTLRECWALVSAPIQTKVLLLEEVGDGCFRRIGAALHGRDEVIDADTFARFPVMDFTLI